MSSRKTKEKNRAVAEVYYKLIFEAQRKAETEQQEQSQYFYETYQRPKEEKLLKEKEQAEAELKNFLDAEIQYFLK